MIIMNGQMSKGQNFTSIQVDWANMQKVFLKDTLQLTGMEVSLNRLPPGEGSHFRHKHKQNEELFIIVKGSGQLQVDGKIIDVREGTSIRVAPDGVRAIRNNSSEDLYYICIQAKEGSLTAYTKTDGIITDKTVEW
ncbi:cupin domain-containing protein [Collibacillus ludicampi]|uniref:cupin domain-containing protein n=1 Tax=Collibacillus ludicampi TaxID=2771369 RepID=UPI003F720E8C